MAGTVLTQRGWVEVERWMDGHSDSSAGMGGCGGMEGWEQRLLSRGCVEVVVFVNELRWWWVVVETEGNSRICVKMVAREASAVGSLKAGPHARKKTRWCKTR